jgi:hypothetical protein
MVSGWTEFTVDTVLNGMPTDMGNLYRSWVDANPSKTNRLAELVAETLGIFREAVSTQSRVVMDENPAMIPVTGFRHALNLVVFNLGMEMGIQFAPEVYGLNVQANIWLRMVQAGSLRSLDATTAGSPRYGRAGRRRRVRSEY